MHRTTRHVISMARIALHMHGHILCQKIGVELYMKDKRVESSLMTVVSSYENICRILCQKIGVELYMQDMRVVTSLMILILEGDILTRQSCRVGRVGAWDGKERT